MKKVFLFAFLLSVVFISGYSQDNDKYLDLDINVVRIFGLEPSIGLKLKPFDQLGVYCIGGFECHYHKPGDVISFPL